MSPLPALLAILLVSAGAETTSTPARPEQVAWREGGLAAAVKSAQAAGVPLLLEFSTQTCPWCQRLRNETWVQKDVAAELANWTCVRLDLTADEDGVLASQEAAELGNRYGIGRFPTIIALRPDGTPEDAVAGYLNAPSMLAELRRIRRGEGTLGDYERRVATHSNDLEARYQLGLKSYSVGDYAGFQTQMDLIEAADPEGRSLPMRRNAIGQMREEMFGCMRGARPVEPEPLVEFLKEETQPLILCEGWSVLGSVYRHLDQASNMVSAWRRAWKAAPESERISCGNSLAWDFWEMRASLSKEDQAFALDVSQLVTTELGDARGDDLLRASFLDTLACCYFMNGDRDSALRMVTECRRLAPAEELYEERQREFGG